MPGTRTGEDEEGEDEASSGREADSAQTNHDAPLPGESLNVAILRWTARNVKILLFRSGCAQGSVRLPAEDGREDGSIVGYAVAGAVP